MKTGLSRLVLALLTLLVLAVPAWAEGPILHEYFEPDPSDDLRLQATTRSGSMPAAMDTESGVVQAPDADKNPYGSETTYGGTSTPDSTDASYRVDRNTTQPNMVGYDDPFIPAITPFKRLFAYDAVDDGLQLVVYDKGLDPLEIGGEPRPGEDAFYADMVVDLAKDTPVRIPSVGPGARVLAATLSPHTEFTLWRDGADNWFIKANERRRVRLVMQLSIARAVFGSEFADVAWGRLAPVVPPLPASVRATARDVLGEIGVSPVLRPRAALQRLVSYFRGFAPSTALPEASGGADLYRELALSRKGVCRHRAYAFVLTALELGLPARMVRNEAHAWVEVFDGNIWHRIDLGGAADQMEVSETDTRQQHLPPDDPYAWPDGSQSGREMAERALADAAEAETSRAPDETTSRQRDPAPAPVPQNPSEQDPDDPRPPAQLSYQVQERGVRRGEAFRVSGRVMVEDHGCAHARVDVALLDPDDNRIAIQSIASDAEGRYDMPVVMPLKVDVGDYEVVVSTPGTASCGPGLAK